MTSSALSSNQDQVLEAFIALVRQNSDLKAQIKAALNQDQVIEIAASNGFDIDSSAILRKWSKHTDCLLYTSPSPRDATLSRMPSSA